MTKKSANHQTRTTETSKKNSSRNNCKAANSLKTHKNSPGASSFDPVYTHTVLLFNVNGPLRSINSWDDQPLAEAPCTRITLRTDSLLYESRLSPHSSDAQGRRKPLNTSEYCSKVPSERFSKFHFESQNLPRFGTRCSKSTAICRL